MSDVSFYSVDKLVEFGMSAAIANQMVLSMNQNLANMQIPGAGKADTTLERGKDIFYVVLDGKASGPYSSVEISRMVSEKKIFKETYIWKPGMYKWEMAEKVDDLMRLISITPPPVPK